MIKIEFADGNTVAAAAFSRALAEIAGIEPVTATLGTFAPADPADVDKGIVHLDAPAESAAQKPANEKAPAAGADGDRRVDTKGVRFDSTYCGKADDPFYASSVRKGQWKKKRGLDDTTYDEWYAGQLALVALATPAADEAGVNTGEAFGDGKAAPAPAPTPNAAPTDFGTFIKWVCEHQAAGRLEQADLDVAYTAVGVAPSDLWPPATVEQITERIGRLHAYLGAKAAQ